MNTGNNTGNSHELAPAPSTLKTTAAGLAAGKPLGHAAVNMGPTGASSLFNHKPKQ
jgi:hypothetical protein